MKPYLGSRTKTKESGSRIDRRAIAEGTLGAISDGTYTLENVTYDLHSACQLSKKGTAYYAPDSLLSQWSAQGPESRLVHMGQKTEISVLETSTLEGARLLASIVSIQSDPRNDVATNMLRQEKIGILNFASAKNPGGGFLTGAQAQEESIARSSTLYPTLMIPGAQRFYTIHKKDPKGGYYSHAMIYSPCVLLIRDDNGEWVEPLEVDVLTSAAVNAGLVRKKTLEKDPEVTEEVKIGNVMKERMARLLYLFEKRGVKNVVLGSFGTGVFQNDVSVVAGHWAELINVPGSRFQNSFERVVFAVLGKKTFEEFKQAFEGRQV